MPRSAWPAVRGVLDLTYHLSNTQDRSRGFVAGLLEAQPAADVVLSLATQSDRQSAYRLTSDALHVHPDINVIFCINDILACGAIQACQDMGIDPDAVLVVTFGLEGNTLKDELMQRTYLKAGLAMFPEIVGRVCVEAAIGAYKGLDLPPKLVTPHAVLTAETLADFYVRHDGTWHLNLAAAAASLPIPLAFTAFGGGSLPRRIGFLVPFGEHEWYRSLVTAMRGYAGNLGIGVMLADVTENLKEELALRKLSIARAASSLVKPGDVILIDSGQVTTFLAQALRGMSGITVITNALGVFDALRDLPGINLLVTGGVLRHESQALIGPTVESILRELRADKLFLAVSGVSIGFGLSHTNPAEVAIKQAMIRAGARSSCSPTIPNSSRSPLCRLLRSKSSTGLSPTTPFLPAAVSNWPSWGSRLFWPRVSQFGERHCPLYLFPRTLTQSIISIFPNAFAHDGG